MRRARIDEVVALPDVRPGCVWEATREASSGVWTGTWDHGSVGVFALARSSASGGRVKNRVDFFLPSKVAKTSAKGLVRSAGGSRSKEPVASTLLVVLSGRMRKRARRSAAS